jgi:hypothetical protein
VRASDLLGATAISASGAPLGRISELLCETGPDGVPKIVEVEVTRGRRLRLLGYERAGIQGPWVLEKLASWLHRHTQTIPWQDLNLLHPYGKD